MKNLILAVSFLIIIPISGGKSNNKGCNSKKNETTKNEKNNKDENSELNKENKSKKGSAGSSFEIYCYPYYSTK